jgi:competence protein ComEA
MNRLKVLIRSLFGFSRTETNAFLILLPLMTVMIFSEPIYRFLTIQRKDNFSKEKTELDSLVARWDFQKHPDGSLRSEKDKFKFNPNTATEDDFLALGFPGNLAQRMLNFRTKNGKFSIKSDVMKIYGMDSSLYRELNPFIDLPEKKTLPIEKAKTSTSKKSEKQLFDLNQADTAQLKTIYGIGPVLASRIIAHRTKLGGFISVHQLNEVYGLDTVVVNRLTRESFLLENFIPSQLDINQADEKTLASHPYIKFKLAQAIVAYRFQHGNFKTIDDLTRIQTMKPETLEKLRPYLTF